MNNAIDNFLNLIEHFSENIIYLFDHQGNLISRKNPAFLIDDNTVQNYLAQVKEKKEAMWDIENQASLQGVYLFDELYGMIIIQGGFKETKPIINVLKDSLEIKLLYEHDLREKGINNQILELLLNINENNITKINTMIRKANIDFSGYNRACATKYNEDVYIRLKNGFSNYMDKPVFIAHDNEYIYLAFEENHKEKISNEHKIINEIRKEITQIDKIYISSEILEISEYKDFHKKMELLQSNLLIKEQDIYVQSYLTYYLMSLIPKNEIEKVVRKYIGLKDFDSEKFMEIFPTLIEYNYNVSKSSEVLFLHKNTISYRLRNIEQDFNLDPLNSENDRFIIKIICYYFASRMGIDNDEK